MSPAGEVTRRADETVPAWLWRWGVGGLALLLLALAALAAALALGWNDPRPGRAADWQAPGLPATLTAAPEETAVALLDREDGDFILVGEAIPLSGPAFNGYGVVYRARDPAHYYVFAVGGDGYYAVLRVEGGQETALVDWQQFPHVRRGERANRLGVRCQGSTCSFTINDEHAATVEDDAWLAGRVGLWVRGFEGEVRVQFETLRLWEQ